MKRTLCIIASVLFLPMAAGAQNLSPVASDLPELRLQVGQAAPGLLNLNKFVRDFNDVSFDDDIFNLAWSSFRIDPAAVETISATGVLSLSAPGAPSSGGVYLFSVQDPATNQGGATVSFRASSFTLEDPWLGPDPRIDPQPGDAPYLFALDPQPGGSGIWEATGVFQSNAATPLSWTNAYISQVYDATGDFDPSFATIVQGNPVGIADTVAVAAPAGGNFIVSGGTQLEGPYLVGFSAQAAANDWDGATVMVTGNILSDARQLQDAAPDYARDERFEGIAGELSRVGYNRYNPNPISGNRFPGQAPCSWEHVVGQAASAGVQYGSATVVLNNTLPAALQAQNASFRDDHSGNALRVRVWPNKPLVFVNRARSLPAGVVVANDTGTIDAGRPYAVDASIATSATNPAHAPTVQIALTTESFTDGSASALAQESLPLASDGWVRMRSVLEPTNSALQSVPAGLRVNIIVTASPNATGPEDVFIDNVYFYRTAFDSDLARGATRIPIHGGPATNFPGRVRGDFEDLVGPLRGPGVNTGGNSNSWFISKVGAFGSAPVGSFIGVDTSSQSTVVKQGDANWLEFNFTPGLAVTDAKVEIRTPDLVSGTSTPLSDGIYELHFDLISPFGAAVVPDIVVALSSSDFKSYTRYETRSAPGFPAGTQGAVRHVRLTAALRNVTSLVALLVPVQHGIPSADSSASIDNVTLHRIDDRPEFWDQSLFDSAP